MSPIAERTWASASSSGGAPKSAAASAFAPGGSFKLDLGAMAFARSAV